MIQFAIRKNRAIFLTLAVLMVSLGLVACTGSDKKADGGNLELDLKADTSAKKAKPVVKDHPGVDTLLIAYEKAVDGYLSAQKNAVNPVADPAIDKALDVVIQKGKAMDSLIKANVASPKQLERYAKAQERMTSNM